MSILQVLDVASMSIDDSSMKVEQESMNKPADLT